MKCKIVKKLTIGILTVAVTAVLATGCGGNSSDAGTESGDSEAQGTLDSGEGKSITIGVTSFADTLEPTEQYFSWVISRYGIGECLARFDEKGEMVPCLAESWENSEDGMTWTFKLREGVKFSNGNEMTPEAVKASLERTIEKSDRVPEFFDLSSLTVDGQNLIFQLNRANANMAGSLADPLFLIMDTSVDDSNIEMEGPVCTGPYAVESFSPTDACVVVKNE